MKRRERKDYEDYEAQIRGLKADIEEWKTKVTQQLGRELIAYKEAASWKNKANASVLREREALERVEELAEEAAELRRKLYFRERVERGIFGLDCDGDHVRGVFDDKCLRCRKSTGEDEED